MRLVWRIARNSSLLSILVGNPGILRLLQPSLPYPIFIPFHITLAHLHWRLIPNIWWIDFVFVISFYICDSGLIVCFIHIAILAEISLVPFSFAVWHCYAFFFFSFLQSHCSLQPHCLFYFSFLASLSNILPTLVTFANAIPELIIVAIVFHLFFFFFSFFPKEKNRTCIVAPHLRGLWPCI